MSRRFLLAALTLGVGCADAGEPPVAAPRCGPESCSAALGKRCVNDSCLECEADAECVEREGAGAYCAGGTCRVLVECKDDSGCAQGERCEQHQCVAAQAVAGAPAKDAGPQLCGLDSDCGAGHICVKNLCEAGRRATPKVTLAARPEAARPDAARPEAALPEVVAAPVAAAPACARVFESGARIYFEPAMSTVPRAARTSLEDVARCLPAGATLRVIIEGHTDARGPSEVNERLGGARAATIARYLAELGVPGAVVEHASKGEREPLCNDESDECLARNRRAEIRVSASR